jgi:hypothetical protein
MNIREQFSMAQSETSLMTLTTITRTSVEEGFISASISVGGTDETISYGDLADPKAVSLILRSGDPVLVGLDGTNYPFRLAVIGEPMLLKLNTELVSATAIHVKSEGTASQLVVAVAPL